MIYNADALRNLNWPGRGLKDGRYVLARPLRYAPFLRRVQIAWGVFTGRYDALEWTDQPAQSER